MSPQTTPLSAADAAWLHMEHPTNLMMITGVLLLKQPVEVARVREVYRVRLLQFRRFRQVVMENPVPLGMPFWQDDPHFNLDAHIHHIALPGEGNRAQLIALLSDLASTPLDFTKPLWQVHVVDNVEGGAALVMRLHHCIGDGTALVAVTLNLLDSDPNAPLELPPRRERKPRSLLETLTGNARSVLAGTRALLGNVWSESMESFLHPDHLVEMGREATRAATQGVATLGRALVQANDPITPLKGMLGVTKRVAWSKPVALDETKAMAHALGAKINDVLVAAMTGALRTYLLEKGTNVTDMTISAVVPVDLRPADRALDLGNVFGLVFLAMPVGLEDPMARLIAVKRRMDALKSSNEALLYYGLLNLFGATPRQVEESAVVFFAARATTVFTNVVGPRAPLYLAGSEIDNIVFWVPQSGRLAMGISIYSYNNQITLGVITDAGIVADPERITEAFAEEYQLLARVARERHIAQEERAHAKPRCAAFTRTGSPCRNASLPGMAYCRIHAAHHP